MSIFQKMAGNKATVSAAVNLPPVTALSLPPMLRGIIHTAKNTKLDWHDPAIQVSSSTRSKRKRHHNVLQPGIPKWDPGRDPNLDCKLFKIKVPMQMYSLPATIMAMDVDLVLDNDMETKQSRTDWYNLLSTSANNNLKCSGIGVFNYSWKRMSDGHQTMISFLS
jgi:hypothetical protein